MERLASINFFDYNFEANFGKITKTTGEKLSRFVNNVYSVKLNITVDGTLDSDAKIDLMFLDDDKSLLSRQVVTIGNSDSNSVVQKEFNVKNPNFVAFIDCSIAVENNTSDVRIKIDAELFDYLKPTNTYDLVSSAPKSAEFVLTGNGGAAGSTVTVDVELLDGKNSKLDSKYLTGLHVVDASTLTLDSIDTVAVTSGSVYKEVVANSDLVVINDDDGELSIDLTHSAAKEIKLMFELKTGEVILTDTIKWV